MVRVTQAFSDATFELPTYDEEYDDISSLPEQVVSIARVITPTENDYRGGSNLDYSNEPELAYYRGVTTNRVYQQDLLNVPHSVSVLKMPYAKFVNMLQASIVVDAQVDQDKGQIQ